MEYEKCLVELDAVLNHLSIEDLKKIPEDIINGIKEKKDKEYIWEYDESKSLKEQQLDRRTIAMLAYLNTEYLLNDEQKELMEQYHELNEKKAEIEKREKYNPDTLFENKENGKNNEKNKDFYLVPVKREKWYSKVFNFFKNIFKRKEEF